MIDKQELLLLLKESLSVQTSTRDVYDAVDKMYKQEVTIKVFFENELVTTSYPW